MSSPKRPKSNKKQRHSEDHLSIASINPAEHTKKGMSTEQIILQPIHTKSTLHGKASMHNYSLPLPSGIQISVVIEALKQAIGSEVIYCNEEKGQMLIQSPKKTKLWDFVDCLLCFKIEGSSKGALAQSYNVYAIKLSKEVIEQKCTITIKPSHPKSKDPYYMKLIKLIQNQVKALPQSPNIFHKVNSNFLEFDSPLHRQIIAYKSIQKFFTSDKRYKTLYDKAIQNVHQKIQELRKQNSNSKNKRIDLVETTVNSSNSLFTSFNYDQPQNHSLHQEYCLYSIENLVCTSVLSDVKKAYIEQTKDQCKIFNEKIDFINQALSNQQCWKYLECRDKYTLPHQNQPYYLSILSLKQIQYANCFREMLLTVQKCFSQAKVSCLIEHKGNVQLSTMDDILPVMIYIVIRASIKDFPAYVKMVDDYVRTRGTFELEERVVTSLYVAVQDVTKKWNLEAKRQEYRVKKEKDEKQQKDPKDQSQKEQKVQKQPIKESPIKQQQSQEQTPQEVERQQEVEKKNENEDQVSEQKTADN